MRPSAAAAAAAVNASHPPAVGSSLVAEDPHKHAPYRSPHCYECDKEFSIMRWQHLCKKCYRNVCYECSQFKDKVNNRTRFCDRCLNLVSPMSSPVVAAIVGQERPTLKLPESSMGASNNSDKKQVSNSKSILEEAPEEERPGNLMPELAKPFSKSKESQPGPRQCCAVW